MNASTAVEGVVRDSYGRLMAFMVSRTNDVAAAEDALSEAFRAALEQWPVSGVPAAPEAWLLTVARRRWMDEARKAAVRQQFQSDVWRAAEEAAAHPAGFPDERLRMLFACAHPALDPLVRTPLMLQAVLGVPSGMIAAAFVVSPAAMAQRLVRAKAKLKQTRVSFRVPDEAEMPARLAVVLDAIYAAYGTGWADATGDDPRRSGLVSEALYLARLVARLMPTEPGAHGLLALVLHSEARRQARRGDAGEFIPLDTQDTGLWDAAMIDEAEAALRRALNSGMPGRYQLEALVQSVHAERRTTGATNWVALDALYGMLRETAPTLGATVAHAAVVARTRGADAAVALLDSIEPVRVQAYQPFWAVRAHVLAEGGQFAASREAYRRAAGLADDAAVRRFLLDRVEELPA